MYTFLGGPNPPNIPSSCQRCQLGCQQYHIICILVYSSSTLFLSPWSTTVRIKNRLRSFLINIPLFLFFQLQCYLEFVFVQIYFCFTSQSWSIKLPNKIDPATSLQLAAANLLIIDPVPKYSRPTKYFKKKTLYIRFVCPGTLQTAQRAIWPKRSNMTRVVEDYWSSNIIIHYASTRNFLASFVYIQTSTCYTWLNALDIVRLIMKLSFDQLCHCP